MLSHAKDPLARGQPAIASRVSVAVYGASYLTEALALLLPQVPGHLAGLQALGEMNSENQSVNTGKKQSPKGKNPPVHTPDFSGPTFPSDLRKSSRSAAHRNCVYHRNPSQGRHDRAGTERHTFPHNRERKAAESGGDKQEKQVCSLSGSALWILTFIQ